MTTIFKPNSTTEGFWADEKGNVRALKKVLIGYAGGDCIRSFSRHKIMPILFTGTQEDAARWMQSAATLTTEAAR